MAKNELEQNFNKAKAEFEGVEQSYNEISEKINELNREINALEEQKYALQAGGVGISHVMQTVAEIKSKRETRQELINEQRELQPIVILARNLFTQAKQQKAAADYAVHLETLTPKAMEIYQALLGVHKLLCQYKKAHDQVDRLYSDKGNVVVQVDFDVLNIPESTWQSINTALEKIEMANLSSQKKSIFQRLGLPESGGGERSAEYDGRGESKS